MTLADLIADEVNDVHLKSGEFMETVTYLPKGGASRSIDVNRGGRSDKEQAALIDYDSEEIVITCGRNESHAKGGVATPIPGDGIVLAGESHLPRFGFDGEILYADANWIRMVFRRPKPRTLGNAHIERR